MDAGILQHEHVKKEQKYKVWQNGYHAEHIIVINSYVKN
jgi:hypothetical protein